MQNDLKRKLGWIQVTLCSTGFILLVVFSLLRLEGERQREAGIAAFHLAVGSIVAEAQAGETRIELAGATPGVTPEATVAEPNLELWDAKRIREYRESLLQEAGPPLAVMTIEKLNIQVPVYDGADDFNLNRGVARIKGTARVGEVGNLGIAGHRDGFFRGLKDIAVGDGIELMTVQGTEVYNVSSIEIVDPSDTRVLAPTGDRTITLVTCYPFYFVGHAPKRFIVKAAAGHSLANDEKAEVEL